MTAIEIPPGVYAAPTKASKSAQWRETNLMRWKEGKISPFGGWEQYAYSTPATRIRATHRWNDNAGNEWKAFLCEGHIYVEREGNLYDISPTVPLVQPYADVLAGGFGDADFGEGTFGTPRPNRNRETAITPAYTLGNWGEDLLICTSPDGRLLIWHPSTPTVDAVAVTGAPINNRTFIVTAERSVILFQKGGDYRTFGWCDQEDINDWTVAVDSKAGEFQVEPASPILTACRIRGGAIFCTAKQWYTINYVGMPFIYNYDEISTGAIPVSSAAIVDTAAGTFWFSNNGFWMYNGTSISPIVCPIWNWIETLMDPVYTRYEACAVNIESKSEIWFFFVAKGERYNSHCAIFNYREGWWGQAKMSRSCGSSPSYTSFPLLSDGMKVYKHESGLAYPDAPEQPYAETFSMNMGGGAGMSTFLGMVPDVGGEAQSISFRLYVNEQRSENSDQDTEWLSPVVKMYPDGYVEFRETGRDFRLRIESDVSVKSEWTFGMNEVMLKARGGR